MSLSQTFAALADPNRQKILTCLKKSELPVSAIAANLNITLATLSHHLDVLRRANLVSSRRAGRQIFYELNLSVMEEIMEAFTKMFKKGK
jgi:DNA-binding transcriptional ArsR family regulator